MYIIIIIIIINQTSSIDIFLKHLSTAETDHKMAVRPAMLYGLETVALTKRQEAEMGV